MTEMEIPQAARKAYRKLWAGLMAVKPQLDTPYPDDPRWTPWTRFVEPRLTDLSDALTQELTLTASEVKVLTETATRLGRELGKAEAWEQIADEISLGEEWQVEDPRISYVDVQIDKEGYLRLEEIRAARSQPSGAVSDATSGVPRHSEVSEAVRSPQEDFEAGTRFLVVEIPPEAGLENAEALVDLVADAVYGYEVDGQDWDPFVYGWTFPQGQAVERPKRAKRNAS